MELYVELGTGGDKAAKDAFAGCLGVDVEGEGVDELGEGDDVGGCAAQVTEVPCTSCPEFFP